MIADEELGHTDGPIISDPEAGGALHRAFGEWLLTAKPNVVHDPTPPPVIQDVAAVLRITHSLLGTLNVSEKVHRATDSLGRAFLNLVVEPQYLSGQPRTADSNTEYTEPVAIPYAEHAVSREAWTTLEFHSASKVEPRYHADGTGDNDRVLDDAEHGIFGVFDGVGSKNATRAAEVTRDYAHATLLAAVRPTSLISAAQLMHTILDGARLECKRLHVEGGTTANLSFAVDVGGKHYLVVGNAGDSVQYALSDEGAKKITTEQLYDKLPYFIFNSISSEPNFANSLTDEQLKKYVFYPSALNPNSGLAPFTPDSELLRDEVQVFEIKPGMRFVHVSDGITGDYENERLAPAIFDTALRLDTPGAMLEYLFDESRKNDDKSGVGFFVEAA